MTERPADDVRQDEQDPPLTQPEGRHDDEPATGPEQEAEATFPPILPEDLSDETRKALAEPGSARNLPGRGEAGHGEWGAAVPGPDDPDDPDRPGQDREGSGPVPQGESGQDNGSME